MHSPSTHRFSCFALAVVSTTTIAANVANADEIIVASEILRGAEYLSDVQTGYQVDVTSFGGSLRSDGDFVVAGSPSSEFIAIDDPLQLASASGLLNIELHSIRNDATRRLVITAVALAQELPFDPSACDQVWEFGRAVDIDDLGSEEDGSRRCRVVASWHRFASSFCTPRRQAGIFEVTFEANGTANWSINQVLDEPSFGTDYGASIAVEDDRLLVGDPSGGDFPAGGLVHHYTMHSSAYSLADTFEPFGVDSMDFGDCAFDLEDRFLFEGRDDIFGGDLDLSEDGVLAVIGAPGTVDSQANGKGRYTDDAGAIYLVRFDQGSPELRMIPNPDSGSITSCTSGRSGCSPSSEHAQPDGFGTSVAVTLIEDEGIYRVAATAPNDFGLVRGDDGNGGICEEDLGADQGLCRTESGSITVYDFSELGGWPVDGYQWQPEPTLHLSPSGESARTGNWTLAYASIGGHVNGHDAANQVPDFALGGSLDLDGAQILIGGPSGTITGNDTSINDPNCDDWPEAGSERRGSAIFFRLPTNSEETPDSHGELTPSDTDYPSSARFGEAVALVQGHAVVSLAIPESTQCSSQSDIDCVAMGSIYMFDLPDRSNPIPGDLDNNGIVNGADIGLLLTVWGTNNPLGDLNGDGWVSGPDLGLLLVNWNS